MRRSAATLKSDAAILLDDGGCASRLRIGRWVSASAASGSHPPSLVARPIGDDPDVVRGLNLKLDIWDAYAVVHLLMPDLSMKTGGEAVAEVFRRLPLTRRLAGCFAWGAFGVRPFQLGVNVAYTVLDDVRPLLGCNSCGRTRGWVRPLQRLLTWARGLGTRRPPPAVGAHAAPLPARVEIPPIQA